ncbi:MAG TPA: protein kinase [Edaphobacter sp.]|nr:protein kinase [Edaphobacter sp.]
MEQFDSDVNGSRLSGRLIGPYLVQTRIGVGGMGEVYRARDTKLGRDVAIKILPSRFMSDPRLLSRFRREARLLATLNHPHIGAIYGFEIADDIHALVLELIEGDTIADRLRFGPIPVKESLLIARQIAGALDFAHSSGIVHRDLKPGNIKITPHSVVKVLDFGLAKAISLQDETEDGPNGSLEMTLSETADGTILGTPAYMSPEQARGQTVDKRTDIWAFGCVLYEMLTACSAFGRTSMIDTLVAIVKSEPDMSKLPAETSPGVHRLLQRCLEKDPRARLRDVADGMFLLDEPQPPSQAAQTIPHKQPPRNLLKWISLALLFAAAGAGLVYVLRPRGPSVPQAILRTNIILPVGTKLVSSDRELPLAVSPDGSRIAYVADQAGQRRLYVREMNSLEPRLIPGTDEARHPFFSPDGQSIGYFASGALQRVAIGGASPPLRICDVTQQSMGGTWGPHHTIVFATLGSDLMRVSDSGGTPQPLDGSKPAAWPEILPDGKNVLFTTGAGNNLSAFATIPLDGGSRHVFARLTTSPLQEGSVIGSGGSLLEAHVVLTGYLLYGQSPGIVQVVPFNQASRSISEAPVSLVGSVERAMNGGGVYFAVSQTGLLVYASTGHQHQLVWVDRKGNVTPVMEDKGPYRVPRLSPDGKSIAVAISDDTRRSDIWIVDAERGTRRRLTTQDHNLSPVWTPDGAQIVFSSLHGIGELPAAGGAITTLVPIPGSYPTSWSPNGRNLLYETDTPTDRPVSVLTPGETGSPPGRRLTQQGRFNGSIYSPDGRWIAFSAGGGGREEVYVARAPDLSNPVMISNGGGIRPIWSRDGREIFYLQGDAVMRVPIDATRDFHASKPEQLFSGNFNGESHDVTFDVSRDGQRFIMVRGDDAASLTKLTVVQNWPEELKK